MNNMLHLPQVTVEYDYPLPPQQVLLVSGGIPPQENWLQANLNNRILWCADHGVDICHQVGCVPQFLVGDGDSASPEAWQWAAANHTDIRKVPTKKDLTDTQLALKSIRNTYGNGAFTVMTGAWGGRFDHTYSAIFSLQELYSPKYDTILGCIADQKEALFFVKDKENLTLSFKESPKALSLLPLNGESTGVSINGVYWPLEQVMLNNKLPYAVSNEVMPGENKVWISQETGLLGVYVYWE